MVTARERLAARILEALDGGPVESQQVLAAELKTSTGEIAKALALLEKRGLIVRETVPGTVAKAIRLVEARNEVLRALAGERHFTPVEVAALVARGDIVVTQHWVLLRRQNKEIV